MKVAVHDRRGRVVRWVHHRGAIPKRVRLIDEDSSWSEIERDAVTMLECAVANRGTWRRGDVERIPLTISFVQHWLRKTWARRSGRDYARQVRRRLVEMELVRDTGEVLRPRRQPSQFRSYWWPIYEILPVTRAKRGASASAACSASPRTGCLRRFLRSQGVIRRRHKAVPGSVQWVFRHSGPP